MSGLAELSNCVQQGLNITVVIFNGPAVVLNSSTFRAAKADPARTQPNTIDEYFIDSIMQHFVRDIRLLI